MSTEPTVQTRPDGRSQADFFAAVRARGMLNTMLERPAMAFEAANPGLKTRWEWWPANGDMTLVTAREAAGWRVVDASELPDAQDHSQKSGPIRIGDAVLMCAPEEIYNAQMAADAQAAEDDVKLPETAYRENLESNKVMTTTGGMQGAKPVGSVRHQQEVVSPKTKGGD